MFLVVQYPFTDLRSFVSQPTGRLGRPTWPIADVGRDFVRSSGCVLARRRGGVAGWAGEDIFGDASAAVKFPNHLRLHPIAFNHGLGNVDFSFRRFFSDGAVARMDIGMKIRIKANSSNVLVPAFSLLRALMQLEVGVREAGQVPDAMDSEATHQRRVRAFKTVPLIEAGDLLARHFLDATTNHREVPDHDLQSWWFSAAQPALIIEHEGPMQLPKHTQKVLAIGSDAPSLSHSWLQMGQQRCSAWFIDSQGSDPCSVRNLRVHLSRLHVERESLKCLITQLRQHRLDAEGPSPASDALQRYFRDTLHLLQRKRRFGHDQEPMLDAAREAFDSALVGETASLECMRKQVAAQLKIYVARNRSISTVINLIQGDYVSTTINMGNVSVTGDFNVVTAKNIQSSFNKSATAEVTEDLKAKLQDLTVQVAELAKRLPPSEAERVSRDLESLTSEATAKTPRREWLDLSGKGLLEAAKTVAEMAAPVTAAVKAVLTLLAP